MFVEVPENSYPKLVSGLQEHMPKSAMILNLIKIKMSAVSEHLSISTKILTFEGLTDGPNLFVVAIEKPEYYSLPTVLIFAPDHVTPEMLKAFDGVFDWSIKLEFGAIHHSFVQHLKNVLERQGQIHHIGPAILLYMDAEKAVNLDLKYEEGLDVSNVRELEVKDANEIDRNWKFASNGSLQHIQESIQFLTSAGIYVRDNNNDEQLVCGVILSAHGTVNALFTHENYRRRGLGQLAMRAVSKYTANIGCIPVAEVEKDNAASYNLLLKTGFEKCYDSYWLVFNPFETS